MTDFNCPCCSGELYSACCAPYHQALLNPDDASGFPPTAEKLMRSRYCAFVLGLGDYLIETHHPAHRKENDKEQILQTMRNTQWLGLIVVDHQENNDCATVEFSAFFADAPFSQLHERSEFIFENQRWYYLHGEELPGLKLSRNDTCFCGSGKKYKKCHGA